MRARLCACMYARVYVCVCVCARPYRSGVPLRLRGSQSHAPQIRKRVRIARIKDDHITHTHTRTHTRALSPYLAFHLSFSLSLSLSDLSLVPLLIDKPPLLAMYLSVYLCMCECVCVCVYMCACSCICVCMRLYVHVSMSVCVCCVCFVRLFECAYMYVCVLVCCQAFTGR